MIKYFYLKNIRRHFNLTNLVLGIVSLIFVGLFKFCGLADFLLTILSVTSNDFSQYLLSGFFGLVLRLGIKGIVEEILKDVSLPDLTRSYMNMGGDRFYSPGQNVTGSGHSGTPNWSANSGVTDIRGPVTDSPVFQVKDFNFLLDLCKQELNKLNSIRDSLDIANEHISEAKKNYTSCIEYSKKPTSKDMGTYYSEESVKAWYKLKRTKSTFENLSLEFDNQITIIHLTRYNFDDYRNRFPIIISRDGELSNSITPVEQKYDSMYKLKPKMSKVSYLNLKKPRDAEDL